MESLPQEALQGNLRAQGEVLRMGIETMFPVLYPPRGSQPSPALPKQAHPQAFAHAVVPPPRLTYLFPGQLMGQGQFCSTR